MSSFDRNPEEGRPEESPRLSRRSFLRQAAAVGGALAVPGVLAACGGGGGGEGTAAAPTTGAQATTSAGTTAASSGAEEITMGGRLRAGFVGGGPQETLDPHAGVSFIDAAREFQIWDRLVEVVKPGATLEMALAESMEPNADATVWQVKLRPDVTFHDGKPLTADDVLYTINRILDPKSGAFTALELQVVDLKTTKKVSDTEIELHLVQPIANVPLIFSSRLSGIVPADTTDFSNPIGTGPFKYGSFTPGERSLFTKNEDYWRGAPYLDELEMISIPDNQARLNALLGGELDAMENLEFALAKANEGNTAMQILNAPGINPVPMVMSIERPPFDDVRVRQAMRLLADRQALVDGALLGYGQIGNDLFGPGLADYNDQLPQREYDPEQAKSLLAAAGQSDLKVALTTSKAAPGMLESATIFAEQAKQGGVDVTVDQTPADSYYTDKYLKVPFFYTQWNTLPVEFFMFSTFLTDSPYNETGWKRPEWDKKFKEARATLDEARRQELFFETQKEVWEEGGYLMWGFNNWVDGLGANVRGMEPSPVLALNGYNFTKAWLA